MSQLRFLIRNSLVSPLGGIKLAGAIMNSEGVQTPTRVLNRHSLVLVLGGEGEYRDDSGTQLDLIPGDILLVDPDISHWYGPKKGKHWDELFIIFEGPMFDLWCQPPFLDFSKRRIHMSSVSHWSEKFNWACGRQHSDEPDLLTQDALRLQQLLFEVHQASRIQQPRHGWIAQAKAALQQTTDPHEAALKLGVSYDTFRKKFKRINGIPPQQYLILIKIKQAQTLLEKESEPIYKIALQLGYCDEFHFSKQFTKLVGCSPSEYRTLSLVSNDSND